MLTRWLLNSAVSSAKESLRDLSRQRNASQGCSRDCFSLFMQTQEVKGLICPFWFWILILRSGGSLGVRPKAPKDSLTQCRKAVFPPCAFLISLAVNLQRNSSVGGWSPGSSVFQPWQSKFLFLQVPFLEKLSREHRELEEQGCQLPGLVFWKLSCGVFAHLCILSGWVVGCSGALSVCLILLKPIPMLFSWKLHRMQSASLHYLLFLFAGFCPSLFSHPC